MNAKNTPQKVERKDEKMELIFDITSFKRQQQSEIVLISLHKVFRKEIKQNYLLLTSYEKNNLHHIEINCTSAMKPDYVRGVVEIINQTAYLAVEVEERAEFFDTDSDIPEDFSFSHQFTDIG